MGLPCRSVRRGRRRRARSAAPSLRLFLFHRVVTMKRCLLLLLCTFLVGVNGWAFAQESPYAEDMRFIQELRTHGYSDLAREYLEKLTKTAPPDLKKELPLEIALTNLEAAGEEPDSNKRLSLYTQARTDFEKFLRQSQSPPDQRSALRHRSRHLLAGQDPAQPSLARRRLAGAHRRGTQSAAPRSRKLSSNSRSCPQRRKPNWRWA